MTVLWISCDSSLANFNCKFLKSTNSLAQIRVLQSQGCRWSLASKAFSYPVAGSSISLSREKKNATFLKATCQFNLVLSVFKEQVSP